MRRKQQQDHSRKVYYAITKDEESCSSRGTWKGRSRVSCNRQINVRFSNQILSLTSRWTISDHWTYSDLIVSLILQGEGTRSPPGRGACLWFTTRRYMYRRGEPHVSSCTRVLCPSSIIRESSDRTHTHASSKAKEFADLLSHSQLFLVRILCLYNVNNSNVCIYKFFFCKL